MNGQSSVRTSSDQSPNSKRLLIFLLHSGFFLVGIVTVFLGQILPFLAKRLELTDSQGGTFFTAQFTGSIIGTLISSFLQRRFGFSRSLAAGFLMMTIGVAALTSPDHILCLLAVVIYGIGIGLTIPLTNLFTVTLYEPDKQTSAVNFINSFWGLGAIVSQPFVAILAREFSFAAPLIVLSIAAFVFAILFYVNKDSRGEQKSESSLKGDESQTSIWWQPIAWAIAAFNFIHVGVESGVGFWLTTYSERLLGGNAGWLSPTPIYFATFVFGRALAGFVARRFTENQLLILFTLILLAGVFVLLKAESFTMLAAGAAITGLGTASIFPTNMVRFTKVLGAQAMRESTPLFISGTLGGALITKIIGNVSDSYGNLQSGMSVMIVSCICLVVLQILIAGKTRKAN